MTGRVTAIYRHPVKAIGRERLDQVTLTPGKCLPLDRVWAVTHARSKWDADAPQWMHCANFLRGANHPALQAVDVRMDGETTATFTHPDREAVSVDLAHAGGQAMFLAWVDGLVGDAARAQAVVSAPDRGMTDTTRATVSLMNLSSLRALSQKAGQDLSPLRFRGNVWFDGLGPWEEFEWVGRDIRLGTAVLHVGDRIERCNATLANPQTGRRDVDVLKALRDGWGHQDFGVAAVVVTGGEVRMGDRPEVI